MTDASALELRDVDVVYTVRGIDRPVLRGVSLEIGRGESYGLVGESGCGKSTAALAIVRYLARNGRVSGGSISVAGRDVLGLRGGGLRRYRAETVSMVYQNPGAALNPSIRVGAQVAEAFTVLGASRSAAEERAREALALVQIADPGSVMSRFAHQLSGGMQQRVVIAMALAKNPALLVLDEPTTGLDATVEAEVLDLVSRLQRELHTSVLFISHNLGVISKMCSRVGVLYAGKARGGRSGRNRPPRPAPPVHGRASALHPARRCAKGPRPARHDPRVPTRARNRADRMRVRRSLRAGGRALSGRGAAAHHDRRRPRESLLVSRPRARAPARGGGGPRARPSRSRFGADRPGRGAVEGVQAARPRGACTHGRERGDLARRDARARRRVGQRQDDARENAARHRPADDGNGAPRRRTSPHALPEAVARRSCARCRSSSRIPTRLSIGATRSAASFSAR